MPAQPQRRVTGVLLHPTSLPGGFGIGDLGAAPRFLDFLSRAGVRAWQILPLVPPGAGDSPYSSASAFAGNVDLISLQPLVEAGLLGADQLHNAPYFSTDRVDFQAARAFKRPRLEAAARALFENTQHPWWPDLDAFRDDNPWLEDTTRFFAIAADQGGAPWWTWPAPLRDYDLKLMEVDFERIELEIIQQYFFERQWREVRALAASKGIEIIGDLPIYVDINSADVWANRHLFKLSPEGLRLEYAGVPPDAFSATGQAWGNPLYDWDEMEANHFGWWIRRMQRALELHDRVRIDHFRAFSAYWAIPNGAQDAREGAWRPGPGMKVFDALREALGALPILAEDLGIIDEPVRQLLKDSGFPGMRILQFAFGEDATHAYLPHNHIKNSVVYTGTHDNETTLGWWFSTNNRVRDHVRRYFGIDGHDLVWDMIRAAVSSVADTAIIPMQDLLALDNQGRMNTPAVSNGNWGWRVRSEALHHNIADRLRDLNQLYNRC
ncbi:4-alpha-glucanotransferase [Myxococcota bacterium]|nr:4-alpha-glucanotransferase [Myxococcota bacterium]MBU1433248.1 4-alpha-glucanotransferase [Myxococcota bacterium]MBU1896896.1 4-alpha-glucanotransferase [Myxococcota bacterium]